MADHRPRAKGCEIAECEEAVGLLQRHWRRQKNRLLKERHLPEAERTQSKEDRHGKEKADGM